MDLYTIVKKLTGPISSVGETNADRERLKNLSDLIVLTDKLIFDIADAAKTKDYPEHSRSEIGKKAQAFLDDLRESLNDE